MYPYHTTKGAQIRRRPARPWTRKNKATHKRTNVISISPLVLYRRCANCSTVLYENTVLRVPRSVETALCICRGAVAGNYYYRSQCLSAGRSSVYMDYCICEETSHYEFVLQCVATKSGSTLPSNEIQERRESGRPQLDNDGPMSVYGITTNKMRKCAWYLKGLGWLNFCQKQTARQYVNDA